VCCHQDHAGVGVAVPDALNDFRLQTLKRYGVNAYRTSHNAPATELLDACDRLGILVMDETREPGSTPEALDELTWLVRRDRNHPCVILWSMANEERIQGRNEAVRVGGTMKQAILALDRTRPITAGMNSGSSDGFSKVSDVRGFNYHEKEIERYRQQNPGQPLVGSEVASSRSTRGVYRTDPARCTISTLETDQKVIGPASPEQWWSFYVKHPYLAGGFVWTGFDYRGEPHPYAWPAISSQYGFLDTCGFPKDNAFYYLAWWSDRPMVHLAPHWNWPGREGEPLAVRVDGNCDEVELFLNGRSLGRKVMPRQSHLEWTVAYAPGELSAKGYSGGREVATTTNRTTGAPAAILLTPDKSSLATDGEDVVVVNVAVVDARGDVVPTAENEIVFTLDGGAKIIGVGNGDPTSHEPDHADRRKAFNGYAQLILQSTGDTSAATVRAESPGLASGTVELTSRSVERRPFVPLVATK
jgi:beta-galactosidase